MTPIEFCRWLQGFFELKKTIDCREGATPETMKMIEDHLQLVFNKVTSPSISDILRDMTTVKPAIWELPTELKPLTPVC